MERVVYLLGAGFSAPLGIPTVANFIETAKDCYFEDEKKYAHFGPIIKDIHDLGSTKVVFHANTFDLEEVLSILQTEKELEGTGRADEFKKLIEDVVVASTPEIECGPKDWRRRLENNNEAWSPYLRFVAHLFRLRLELSAPVGGLQGFSAQHADHPADDLVTYDVVSLNYDCILERAARWFARLSNPQAPWLGFKRTVMPGEDFDAPHPITGRHCPILAKLHGCSETGGIVAPTANKRLNDDLLMQWKMAHHVLSRANHVRIIGYSLPAGDASVRYLLKSALRQAKHLKSLDVLCLDPTETVERRYSEFVSFYKWRFKSVDVWDRYLVGCRSHSMASPDGKIFDMFTGLDTTHYQCFGR